MFTEGSPKDDIVAETLGIQVEDTQETEENAAEEVEETDVTVEIEESANETVEGEKPAENETEAMDTTEKNDEAPKKAVKKSFFVGNVAFATTQEKFEEHCKTYGEMKKCTLMKNGKRTANPTGHRGFGFVHFITQEATDKFEADSHNMDDRKWNVSPAKPKTQKLFIAPIDRSVTNKETITAYFEKFGEVQDVYHNVNRGFAFITIVDEGDNLKPLMDNTHQTIDGKKMECKLAKPRRDGDNFGRGGRGRGRGGRGRGGFGAWGPPPGAWGPNPWAMKAMYSPYQAASAYGGYGGYQQGGRGGRGGRRGRGRNY